MTKYDVGQVVYLLNKENLKIVPAIIKEEITKKTIEHVNTHYILELPDKSLVNLENISQTIFSDIKSLKEFMLENTRISIEKLIENALEIEKMSFHNSKNTDNIISIDIEKNEKHMQNNIQDVIMNSNTNSKEEL
jgi:hypothetical protein